MKLLKFFVVCAVILLLNGCANEKPNPNFFSDLTEINEANLVQLFDIVEMDVDYPYGLDYYLKERILNVDLIEQYWFEKVSPDPFIEGKNNVSIKVVYPDLEERIFNVVISCYKMTYNYDVNNLLFDPLTQTITGYKGHISQVVIPEKIDGVVVKHIGEYAFKEKGLSGIYLPNTIVSIKEGSFELNMLSSLYLPRSVEMVGKRAFANNDFETIYLEERMLTFGDSVLANNPVQNIIISGDLGIDVLGRDWKRAGLPLNLLPDIKIKQGVYYSEETKIVYGYEYTLGISVNSSSLNRTIESLDVNHIGDYAFSEMSISLFTVPTNIVSIGKYAYAYTPISNLLIPETIEFIDDYAFYESEVGEVFLFDTITHFGKNVFENNNISRIIIYNNEFKYNNIWDEVGFPQNLMPTIRDPFDTLAVWEGSGVVQFYDSVLFDDILYGIGLSWSNDGDFADALHKDYNSYILRYDLLTENKKMVFIDEPDFYLSSVVMGHDETLIISGYKFIHDGKVYRPYLLYYNKELELVSMKQIDAPIDMPGKLVINEDNELLLIAASKASHPMDSVLILSQAGDVLYHYSNSQGLKNLSFNDACFDGSDFVLVGWVSSSQTAISSHLEGYIMRINKHGVIWEKRSTHDLMKMHYEIINLGDGNYIISGNTYVSNTDEYAVYFMKIDQNGQVIKEANTLELEISYGRSMQVIDGIIYLVMKPNYHTVYGALMLFDTDLNYVDTKPFVELGHHFNIYPYSEDKLLVVGDSSDRYLANNIPSDYSNLYIFLINNFGS